MKSWGRQNPKTLIGVQVVDSTFLIEPKIFFFNFKVTQVSWHQPVLGHEQVAEVVPGRRMEQAQEGGRICRGHLYHILTFQPVRHSTGLLGFAPTEQLAWI